MRRFVEAASKFSVRSIDLREEGQVEIALLASSTRVVFDKDRLRWVRERREVRSLGSPSQQGRTRRVRN